MLPHVNFPSERNISKINLSRSPQNLLHQASLWILITFYPAVVWHLASLESLCLSVHAPHVIYSSISRVQHLINSPISCQSLWSFPSSLVSSLWENQYSESVISIMLRGVWTEYQVMLHVHGKYAILMSALMTLLKISSLTPPLLSHEYWSSQHSEVYTEPQN